MYVNSIKLINYRNYSGIKVFLNKNINVFLGENGQGKTNLLESIYIASSGKSFKTNKDKELINIDKEVGYIGVELIKNDIKKYIELKLNVNKPKRIKINGVEQDKVSDLNEVLQVVVFSPEDLKIIKGGPSNRRNFLDDEISQIKPLYKSIINDYNRVLTQRNNLLKIIQYDNKKKKMLSVWNEQLVELGTKIMILRKSFINRLANISKDIHNSITSGTENLEIYYSSSFEFKDMDKEAIINKYNKLLSKYENEDIEKGTTKIGPHRDDIEILIDNRNTRVFGSQGQQRTAALSLRLAEIKLIKEETEDYPVLLLDDVFSELDVNRRKYLISTFKDVQTIITSTDDIDIEEIDKSNKKTYYIKDGNILYSK